MPKAVVLLSGGLDSVVSLAMARRYFGALTALTIDYGQQAAARECRAAAEVAKYYRIKQQTVTLPWMDELNHSALRAGGQLPTSVQLEDGAETENSARAVWVPNRNGLFVNIAGSFAESLGASHIIAGFNAEEAKTFPDNSAAFVDSANRLLRWSTRSGVRLWAPTQRLNKRQIVKVGSSLAVPWHLIWSCYGGEQAMCGVCESCRRFRRALKEAGVDGPLFMD